MQNTKFTRRNMLALSTAMLAGSVTSGAQAQQGAKPLIGVVELFTSQGCSSCPPADAALEQFIKRDDVLALAFHVDYWDYLGWKDTLASAENTQRQYAYAKTFKSRTVYTPQAVVNGREHLNGASGGVIAAKLGTHAGQGTGLTVPVSLALEGKRIRVNVDSGTVPEGRDVKVVLVYYRDESTIDIKRGENKGRKITYRNTVTNAQVLGMWDGEKMDVEIPLDEIQAHEANGCAILLQATSASGTPGAILGAAILPRGSA
ncbi:MAG: DUF1223 domain-containing protein [Pseudomonadota bacterium]